MASSIPPTFAEYASALTRLEGRARTQHRRELEGLFQVSPTTMSRWLNSIGLVFRERGDKGTRRTEITEEHLRKVFALQFSSYKQTQGPIMPAQVAIEVAEKNSLIPAGILTANSYNAWARGTGIARTEVDTPTRHINLISLGPNHVHQVDFSLAINWKIKNNKAVYDALVYKNKLPAAGEPRLLRLICTDHTTGAIFTWYTAAAGESVSALIEGLWWAWAEKRVAGQSVKTLYPFRGVPRILMMDRGPGARSQIFQNFATRLGVTLNICEGPRSKGQVEGAHWWWEQTFESRFRLDPVVDMERLNDDAVQFAAHLCKTQVHTRTRSTRTAHWEFHINRSFESQLRMPACSFSEMKQIATTNPKEATVAGDGTISFKGEKYRVPEVLLQQKKLLVQYSPFEYPNVVVRSMEANAQPFFCQPIVRNEHGFYVDGAVIGQEFKSHKDSLRTQAVKGAKIAVAELTQAHLVTRGYHLEGLEASGVKSRETEIATAPEQVTVFSNTDARFEVLRRVGRALMPAEKRLFQRFGPTVTEDEIDSLVSAIAAGVETTVVPMIAARA